MLTELHPAVPPVTVYFMSSGGHAGPAEAGLSPPPTSPSLLSLAEQALLSASDPESDDGVAVVMDMLDAERTTIAPLPPPDVDRLLAGWQAAEWGCGHHHPTADAGNTDKHTPQDPLPWTYAEDCVVADIMTSLDPNRQREELRRRLPARNWSDVCARFTHLCDDVVPKRGPVPDNRDPGRWARRRRWDSARAQEPKFKPRCGIVKKLRRWR